MRRIALALLAVATLGVLAACSTVTPGVNWEDPLHPKARTPLDFVP